MDLEQEEIENIDKPEKKKLTFHSPLIPLLENTIKQNPIKELKKLSEELIKFNEYKEEIATTITNPDKLKKLQETFKFTIFSITNNKCLLQSSFNFLFSSFFLISSLHPKQLKGHFIV